MRGFVLTTAVLVGLAGLAAGRTVDESLGTWHIGTFKVTAWGNDRLSFNGAVSAVICNENGEASFTGGYIRLKNNNALPITYGYSGAANLGLAPGEQRIEHLAIYQPADPSKRKNTEIDLTVRYWVEDPAKVAAAQQRTEEQRRLEEQQRLAEQQREAQAREQALQREQAERATRERLEREQAERARAAQRETQAATARIDAQRRADEVRREEERNRAVAIVHTARPEPGRVTASTPSAA